MSDEEIENKIARSLVLEKDKKKTIWCQSCGAAAPLENPRLTEGTQMFITIICPSCGNEIIPPTVLNPPSFRRIEKPRRHRHGNSRNRRGEQEDSE